MVGVALLESVLCCSYIDLSLIIGGGTDFCIIYYAFCLAISVHGALIFFSAIASTFCIKICFPSSVVVVGINNASHIWRAAVAYFYGILVKQPL